MSEPKKQTNIWLPIVIAAALLTVAVIWAIVKKQPAKPTDVNQAHTHEQPVSPIPPTPNEPTATTTKPPLTSKNDLTQIIRRARTWGPTFLAWYGKDAPDFTLTDITGKSHTLSDYRGKNVLLIFWATWCTPCIMEIPHLAELRKNISEDKLVMLAISYISPNNTTEMVKRLVRANQKINYTVISADHSALSAPFTMVNSIPSSFFINPDGKIKLATEGLLTFEDSKAILNAQWP